MSLDLSKDYIYVSYVYKTNEISNKEIKDMKSLIKDIRGHHWALGENKNDYKTTNNGTYLYDQSKAIHAKTNLDSHLMNDLRATHYKLGYTPEMPLTTHQQAYVPVPLGNKTAKDPLLRKSHFDFNANNSRFNSQTVYMTDFTKKEIVE